MCHRCLTDVYFIGLGIGFMYMFFFCFSSSCPVTSTISLILIVCNVMLSPLPSPSIPSTISRVYTYILWKCCNALDFTVHSPHACYSILVITGTIRPCNQLIAPKLSTPSPSSNLNGLNFVSRYTSEDGCAGLGGLDQGRFAFTVVVIEKLAQLYAF